MNEITPVHYTADTVVLGRDQDGLDRVLLIRRAGDSDAYPGCWALPGGYVERHETARAAAVRELAEETGLNLDLRGVTPFPLGVYDGVGRDPRARVITSAFLAVLPDCPEVIGADDAQDAAWFARQQLREGGRTGELRLAFDHGAIVDDAYQLRMAMLSASQGFPHDLLVLLTDGQVGRVIV